MKVTYNITQNKFNAILNQETTEIKVKFQTGYYPLHGGGGGDLSNYYTKDETYSKTEVDDIIADIPVVDTSNLVPYTGANKDVNIASNYFKTSKGFDFTKDADNYFKVSDNGDYNYLDFYTKDNSTDNFGKLRFGINPEEGLVFQKYSYSGNNIFQVTTDSTYSQKKFVTGEGYQIVNGTANQALTANGGTFDLNLKLSIESPSTTGTVISFSTDRVYGTLASPETGNITANTTNAKLGVTNIIIHNSGTVPTFGSQFKKLSGSGNYVTGVVNYIYCTFITATEIIYSINQRS
jgi:hypothetical protein